VSAGVATRLDFVLPGTWWRLPLNESAAATEAAIDRVLLSAIGRRDQDAQLRAELREQLRALVSAGREVRAEQVHFAKDLVGALPFPVSLTVSWPELPVTPRGTVAERAEILASAIPGSLEPSIIEFDHHAATRTVSVRPAHVAADGERLDLPHLDVNYWVAVDGFEKVPVFTFATALVAHEAEIIELFDAIVSTVAVLEDD
jgi:hypothetical protein